MRHKGGVLYSHTPIDMTVRMKDGREFFRRIDIAPSLPGNPLTKKELEARFHDCIAYAEKPPNKEKVEDILESVAHTAAPALGSRLSIRRSHEPG